MEENQRSIKYMLVINPVSPLTILGILLRPKNFESWVLYFSEQLGWINVTQVSFRICFK